MLAALALMTAPRLNARNLTLLILGGAVGLIDTSSSNRGENLMMISVGFKLLVQAQLSNNESVKEMT